MNRLTLLAHPVYLFITVHVSVVQEIALKVKEDIEKFKPFMPLILAVRNPGMRQRHWDNLFEQTGKSSVIIYFIFPMIILL